MRRRAPRTSGLGAAGLAVGEDQRVVLVHRQQAFAAAGRAEHGDRVRRTAARPCPSARMRLSAITAAWRVSAPSSREITAAMSRPASPSSSSAAATCGSFAQARAEGAGARRPRRSRRRARSPRRRAAASRSRADSAPTTRAGVVDDAEMADPQAAHAADGAVDEGVGRHGRERLRHERAPTGIVERRRRRARPIARSRSRSVTMPVSAARDRRRRRDRHGRTARKSSAASGARARRAP